MVCRNLGWPVGVSMLSTGWHRMESSQCSISGDQYIITPWPTTLLTHLRFHLLLLNDICPNEAKSDADLIKELLNIRHSTTQEAGMITRDILWVTRPCSGDCFYNTRTPSPACHCHQNSQPQSDTSNKLIFICTIMLFAENHLTEDCSLTFIWHWVLKNV